MNNKKDGLAKTLGIIMMTAGVIGLLGWLILLVLGFLLSGGTAPEYQTGNGNEMALEYLIPVAAGFLGAVLSLITGIKIVSKKDSSDKTKIVLAALTPIFYIPGIVILSLMWWFFASIPAFLLGVVPPLLYLIRTKSKKEI